jgi:hypothetical protein
MGAKASGVIMERYPVKPSQYVSARRMPNRCSMISVTPATHSTPSCTYIKPPEVVQYCRAVDPAEHVERLAIRRARHGVVAAGRGPLRMHARRSVEARDDLLPRLRPDATQHNHVS